MPVAYLVEVSLLDRKVQATRSRHTGNSHYEVLLYHFRSSKSQPILSLGYSSTGINSVYGLGWDIGIIHIDSAYDRNFPQQPSIAPSYNRQVQ